MPWRSPGIRAGQLAMEHIVSQELFFPGVAEKQVFKQYRQHLGILEHIEAGLFLSTSLIFYYLGSS
jgi:hypothetical protein